MQVQNRHDALTCLCLHGCFRSGEVLLHLAATYPASSFVGYDVSDQALQVARQQQAERGLNNVTFVNPEGGDGQAMLPCTPTFHVVVVQEAIHDMAHPQVTSAFIVYGSGLHPTG